MYLPGRSSRRRASTPRRVPPARARPRGARPPGPEGRASPSPRPRRTRARPGSRPTRAFRSSRSRLARRGRRSRAPRPPRARAPPASLRPAGRALPSQIPPPSERFDVSARTTTSALPPGRRRTRCGSTVISTPFGAMRRFPIETDNRRVETLLNRTTRSIPAVPVAPNERATALRTPPAEPPRGDRRVRRPRPSGRGRTRCADPTRTACRPRASSAGRPSARIAATPAVTAAAALVPLTVPKRISPSSPRPGSDVGTETPGAARSA